MMSPRATSREITGQNQTGVMAQTTRRQFLGWGVAMLPLLAVPALPGRGHAAPRLSLSCPQDFIHVSSVLTGHRDLDPALAPRVWSGLVSKDDGFPARYAMLCKALAAHEIRSWPDYAASGLKAHKALHDVAVGIVGAWYLGRVGPMLPRSETDTPAFITYEGAMMWRPTLDVTVIPSYARGGPGFWALPPSPSAPVISAPVIHETTTLSPAQNGHLF